MCDIENSRADFEELLAVADVASQPEKDRYSFDRVPAKADTIGLQATARALFIQNLII